MSLHDAASALQRLKPAAPQAQAQAQTQAPGEADLLGIGSTTAPQPPLAAAAAPAVVPSSSSSSHHHHTPNRAQTATSSSVGVDLLGLDEIQVSPLVAAMDAAAPPTSTKVPLLAKPPSAVVTGPSPAAVRRPSTGKEVAASPAAQPQPQSQSAKPKAQPPVDASDPFGLNAFTISPPAPVVVPPPAAPAPKPAADPLDDLLAIASRPDTSKGM